MEQPYIKHVHARPGQRLAIGFAAIILIGALLLTLPVASQSGISVGFFEALFTSTSATCVTGLVLSDTGITFSIFGQVVILLLIQIGGLGFMTAALLLFFATGKRVTLSGRLALQEAMNEDSLKGMVRLAKRAIFTTFIIEGFGFIILSIHFMIKNDPRGIWHGLFHAVSAFCNAGFDVFTKGDSLSLFASDPVVLLTLSFLVILGGLGFVVIYDAITVRRFSKLNTHSKLVLIVTTSLLIGGAALILIADWNNPKTLGSMPIGSRFLGAWFQSATARTAGFSGLNQMGISSATLMVTIILMFIGASPASTGGGIKTTTFGMLFLSLRSVVRRRNDIEFANRRLSQDLFKKAMVVIWIYLGATIVFSLIICVVEGAPRGDIGLSQIIYEVVSAIATVGLSTGITPQLHRVSQSILILAMYAGRLGPLSLALAFAHPNTKSSNIHFAQGRIMIG